MVLVYHNANGLDAMTIGFIMSQDHEKVVLSQTIQGGDQPLTVLQKINIQLIRHLREFDSWEELKELANTRRKQALEMLTNLETTGVPYPVCLCPEPEPTPITFLQRLKMMFTKKKR